MNKAARKLLIGKTIVDVRNLHKDEMAHMMWYKNPHVLILNDGSQIVLQSDDEGNDGGAAFVYNQNESHTLYTS
jgi:hypothetical protein